MQWDISQPKEGGNPAICDSMGGSGGHYDKWTKSDAKTVWSHLDCIWHVESKIVKVIEVQWWLPRPREGEKWRGDSKRVQNLSYAR